MKLSTFNSTLPDNLLIRELFFPTTNYTVCFSPIYILTHLLSILFLEHAWQEENSNRIQAAWYTSIFSIDRYITCERSDFMMLWKILLWFWLLLSFPERSISDVTTWVSFKQKQNDTVFATTLKLFVQSDFKFSLERTNRNTLIKERWFFHVVQ